MATSLLRKAGAGAGILVGGFIIAKIVACLVSGESKGERSNGDGNPQDRGEVPKDESLLRKAGAGILVGGVIIATIVACLVSRKSEGGDGNSQDGGEVPKDEKFRNTKNHSEVPKPPMSTPTQKLPDLHRFSFVESKKTLDSSIQHNKGPSSSILLNPETSHQKNEVPDYDSLSRRYAPSSTASNPPKLPETLEKFHEKSTQKPKVLAPSFSPIHIYPNKTEADKAVDGPSSNPASTPPSSPVSSSSSSSFGTRPSSSKPLRASTKPTLYLAPSNLKDSNAKTNYILVEKGVSPIYAIPEDLKDLIKRDVVPGVLKKPLSLSTYKDYFDALLYAEDLYIENWDGYEMENVTLELHEASIYKRKGKHTNLRVNDKKDDKVFVAFEMDSIPEKRPFLLSRDFVSVRPSGKKTEPFQGLVYRVVKSNLVLVEFGDDFHCQHYSACKYDVKFSFNRVCLKRAHQAVAAASDPLFRNFLFPDTVPKNSLVTAQLQSIIPKLDRDQISAVRQILSHKNPPPYLVEGQLSVTKSTVTQSKVLSRTGLVICEAVLEIYRTSSPSCRILICAPVNSTCDVITTCLTKMIPDYDIFRANAAFREYDEVPDDILPNCVYERECFSCPSLQELSNFKVIVSTFMSSFRLHNEGIMAGHFSHIFLVDASSATEPESMVALANLANERTSVIITGAPGNRSGWIRSNIARQNGLKISYFERLRESKLYKSLDPKVITQLGDSGQKSDDTYSSLSYY